MKWIVKQVSEKMKTVGKQIDKMKELKQTNEKLGAQDPSQGDTCKEGNGKDM